MKIIKKILKFIAIIIAIIVVLFYIFDYNYIFRGARIVYFTGHSSAFIDDTPYFDVDTIHKGQAQEWALHKKYNSVKATEKLQSTHNQFETVAFLIVKNDSIFHEYYADNYSKNSQTNSFSMAKSITSALLFKAIQQKKIKSLDTKVIDYLPQLKGEYASGVTVGDLSSMSSGLNWEENYSGPFSITAKANYDDNVTDVMLNLEISEKPAQYFKYLSGNTQLLGMVIEKATGNTLSQYLSESFWQPMGMHDNALWQLDSEENGLAKAFCCIASNARDFARFGQLWINNGKWKGQALIPEKLAIKAQKPRFPKSNYGYGLWLYNYKGKQISYMRGIFGQYVICIPEDNIIIVRLGHKRGIPKGNRSGDDFITYLQESYQMLETIN